MLNTIQWTGRSVRLLDQTALPNAVRYVDITTPARMKQAISTMEVRGAPAIGVAAGYGMALSALNAPEDELPERLQKDGTLLISARPTAVNLPWAVNRIQKAVEGLDDAAAIREKVLAEAIAIHEEDAAANRAIGEYALSLFTPGMGVLTHCNAGALATTAYGTATSAFYLAAERGIPLKLYADETRPRLQGASLTAFELHSAGLDVTLICDNMAAVLMREGKIQAAIVGADRVAANGDTANKIGTFSLSVVAKHFGVPLYIAAPTSTIDMGCTTGADIPIEERDGDEVRKVAGSYITPPDVKVYNPSFDVTPAEHIAAIITERGIARYPYTESLQELMHHV